MTSPKYSSGRMRNSRFPEAVGTMKRSSVQCFSPSARIGWGPPMFSSRVREGRGETDLDKGRIAVQGEDFFQPVAVVVRSHPHLDERTLVPDDFRLINLMRLDAGLPQEIFEPAVGTESP